MNCVAIMGGLGNQFFQYALYRYIRENTNKGVVITKHFYDILLKNNSFATQREFELDKYNTIYSEVSGFIPGDYRCDKDFSDEYLKYDYVYYEGYWDDVNFFDAQSDILKKELTLKEEYIDESMIRIADDMKSCESVSVHIRRSDYLNSVNSNLFENLQMEYYMAAVAHIKERLGTNPKLYLFSDDVEYVKEEMQDFCGCETVIMDKKEAYKDNWVMSKTKHHIIANSTFSLWAGYLTDYEDGITVAPLKWFKDGRNRNLYRKSWSVI